jgi:hypothetical protein
MKSHMAGLLAAVLASLVLASSASAHTCSEHYAACMRNGHGADKCGCARSVCQRKVGSGDAGQRWNGIPGVNACFRK